VSLIVYYVIFMVIGDFAAYLLGLFTEYEWGSQVSLIVFLALYFGFLWVSCEPPRVRRRPFGLSHAAMAGCSSMA
jgi:hypothetical protein